MTYFDDYTIMRPLVMDFTADTKVNNISDQFMFGPALMAAPCMSMVHALGRSISGNLRLV